MKIIEEPVTLETVQKYKDELFLFNEEMEYLQDKRIIKLIDDNGQLIAISMYTYRMNKQDVELFLSAKQEKYKDKLCNSIYLDAVTSIQRNFKAVDSIVAYLKTKCANIWCYSAVDAMSYWNARKDMQYIGENIFITY